MGAAEGAQVEGCRKGNSAAANVLSWCQLPSACAIATTGTFTSAVLQPAHLHGLTAWGESAVTTLFRQSLRKSSARQCFQPLHFSPMWHLRKLQGCRVRGAGVLHIANRQFWIATGSGGTITKAPHQLH